MCGLKSFSRGTTGRANHVRIRSGMFSTFSDYPAGRSDPPPATAGKNRYFPVIPSGMGLFADRYQFSLQFCFGIQPDHFNDIGCHSFYLLDHERVGF
jgi:hypothetical protein